MFVEIWKFACIEFHGFDGQKCRFDLWPWNLDICDHERLWQQNLQIWSLWWEKQENFGVITAANGTKLFLINVILKSV